MYPHRIVNKVPGNLLAEPQNEKQGYIGDLSGKTIPQLNELLERQLKLLAKKSFISKLADKGEKITKLKESIEAELKKRNQSENLSQMLAAMSMNGKEDLEALEWTGRCAPGHVVTAEENNMSDDETDPLRILATHSGTSFNKKKHRILKPEEPLIKPSDIEDEQSDKTKGHDIKQKETEDEVLEEYAKHLCEKMDSVKKTEKTKFLPHRTLKSSAKREAEDGKEGRGRGRWEVTAATPPRPVHGDVKLVSLQESIRLQFEQQQKLKEVQMRHAAERLAAGYSVSIGRAPQQVGDYRDPASGTSSEDEGSEHEVHDEELPDGGGVVIYNLVDDPENS